MQLFCNLYDKHFDLLYHVCVWFKFEKSQIRNHVKLAEGLHHNSYFKIAF